MTSSKTKKRAYDSPLRAEQAKETRARILDAFTEQLADARDEFSIPRVAARAGVSTRTVYHHFPNHEAQVDALAQHIEAKLAGGDVPPKSPRDLERYARDRYRASLEHEALVRAQLAPGIAEHIWQRRRRTRHGAIDAAVAATGADAAEAKLVAALVKHLISARTGMPLLDLYGVAREDAVELGAWAVRVVVEALARGDGPRGVGRKS